MSLRIQLLVVFVVSAATAKAQFLWSNPQPSGWSNTKVAFTGASIGYIMNNNGDVMKTANAGANWTSVANHPRCHAMDVRDSIVMVGGADTTIYISRDSARTWRKGIIRHSELMSKIQLISVDTAYAVSKSPNTGATNLFRSADGGLTWQMVNATFIVKDVDFINSMLGYATSFGGIYKTVDGGINWQQVYTQTGGYSFITVEFINSQVGYAAQDLGVVLKTTDGGVTWTTTLPSTYGRIFTVAFAGASTVFLGGEEGTIYRSTDAGTTWQLVPNRLGDRYAIYSIYSINSTTTFFVGLRGRIFKTSDGGNTYADYSPTYTDVKPLSFPTPEVGYAGVWSDIYKTTNGGQSWLKLPQAPGVTLNDRFQHLHFFSKDTGIALSESPLKIFKTYNGGQTWLAVTVPPLNPQFARGFFVLANTIYLNVQTPVGTHMLRSGNRGESWQTQAVNYSNDNNFRNLFFTDERTGFAVQNPFLFKTADSAKTWTQVPVINNYGFAMNSIWFTTPARGYIGGDGGQNLFTTDSGRTWQQFAVIPGNFNFQNVYAIRFFNTQLGYLVSGSGSIYRTINGGRDWSAEKAAPWDCRTIEMTRDSQVVIGGDYGIILKKDMREWAVDSFDFSQRTPCGVRLSARVTAVLSIADSIRFEYGINGFTRWVASTPSSVADSSIRVEAVLTALSVDSVYTARLHVYHRGQHHYSGTISFRPANSLAQPTVTFNGTTLVSSAPTGNQWFLNGIAIPGATQSSYQPAATGAYTVQQTISGCASALSVVYNYTITAISDPVLGESVKLFPNPLRDNLWVKNNGFKRLRLTLIDLHGRLVKQWETARSIEQFNLQALSTGVYTLIIEEKGTARRAATKLLKL